MAAGANSSRSEAAERAIEIRPQQQDENGSQPTDPREAEFLRSRGTVARYTVEKGQPHRIETLAGVNASRLFDGFEETKKGCSR